ncbi:helix-turn-helix domain-containing protein [Stenotrophomonas maltophilia]|uniref:helix-turn-helix domain-containing protein n=1 Tax=Stenotrophomonas maltophilia TaxID=40324 RepID=UPI0006AC5B3A|nr:helix-turn-helix domain-containing protein [Stenotrophomonas maltophilia]KOQ67076.1 hypothetical protein ABW42_03205 [Stenotrophomonas maltophilia]MCU1204285.1 helix-turn-helix domain-containing protein [Stenotrophomonas maltophilia]
MNTSYRYLGSGLDNVYLQNGYKLLQLASGEEVLHIEDIPGLHTAIASAIVDSPVELDAKTFKFLRKERDLSQRKLAEILGVEEQTVSNWERAKTPIPKSADLVLRALTKECLSNNASLKAIIEHMNELDRERHREEIRIELALNDHWRLAA